MADQDNTEHDLNSHDTHEEEKQQNQEPKSPDSPKSPSVPSDEEKASSSEEEQPIADHQQKENPPGQAEEAESAQPQEPHHEEQAAERHEQLPETHEVHEIPPPSAIQYRQSQEPEKPQVGVYELSSDVYVSAYSNFQDVDAAEKNQPLNKIEESDEVYGLGRKADGEIVQQDLSHQQNESASKQEQLPKKPDVEEQQSPSLEKHSGENLDKPTLDHHVEDHQQEFAESAPAEIVVSELGDSVPVQIILKPSIAHEEVDAEAQQKREAKQQEAEAVVEPPYLHQPDDDAQKQEMKEEPALEQHLDWQPKPKPVSTFVPSTGAHYQTHESLKSNGNVTQGSIIRVNLLDLPQPQPGPMFKTNSQEQLLQTIKLHEESMRKSTEKKKQELEEMKSNSFVHDDKLHIERNNNPTANADFDRKESEVPQPPEVSEAADVEKQKEIKRGDYIGMDGRPKPKKEQKTKDHPEGCKCSLM